MLFPFERGDSSVSLRRGVIVLSHASGVSLSRRRGKVILYFFAFVIKSYYLCYFLNLVPFHIDSPCGSSVI